MQEFNPFWLVLITGLLALFPVLFTMGTAMLKISILLTLIKQALGTQSTPGPIVTMTLSLALTAVVMTPVFEQMQAVLPKDLVQRLSRAPSLEALTELGPAMEPWREFLRAHTDGREREALKALRPEKELGVGAEVLAFMLTELREAFTLGFMLLIPFLVIDLIVSQLLVGLGLTMMSPTMISLPLKLLLFVTTDAWLLIARGVVQSYGS